MALAAVALVALAGFAATGLGAQVIGLRTVDRPGAIQTNVSFAGSRAKAGTTGSKVSYGSATIPVPTGDSTVTLGKCPPKSHIVNGTVGALHGQQARFLTIRGYGPLSPKKWFVDVNNASDTLSPPGFKINAIAFIVCER
jgi:hypothetical protein